MASQATDAVRRPGSLSVTRRSFGKIIVLPVSAVPWLHPTLIKVHAESAEYWDSPHGRILTLIEYATAAVLRKQPPEGENEVVDLT